MSTLQNTGSGLELDGLGCKLSAGAVDVGSSGVPHGCSNACLVQDVQEALLILGLGGRPA